MVATSPPIFRANTENQPSPPPRKARQADRQSRDDASAVGLVNSVLTAALPTVKVGCGRLITKFNDLGGLPLAGPLSSYCLRVQNNYDRGAGKQKVAEEVDPDSLVTKLELQLLHVGHTNEAWMGTGGGGVVGAVGNVVGGVVGGVTNVVGGVVGGVGGRVKGAVLAARLGSPAGRAGGAGGAGGAGDTGIAGGAGGAGDTGEGRSKSTPPPQKTPAPASSAPAAAGAGGAGAGVGSGGGSEELDELDDLDELAPEAAETSVVKVDCSLKADLVFSNEVCFELQGQRWYTPDIGNIGVKDLHVRCDLRLWLDIEGGEVRFAFVHEPNIVWDLEVKVLGLDLPDAIEDGLVPFCLRKVLGRFSPANPILVPFNISEAISGAQITDSLASAVHKAISEDPELGGSMRNNNGQSALATSAGGGAARGGSELHFVSVAVSLIGVALFLSLLGMAAMLGWALSQLATLQDSLEEQGERLEQCFTAVLPSGA